MGGFETSLQIDERPLQRALEDDRGMTGRRCERFGREACGDLAEHGDSNGAFPCCPANQVLDIMNADPVSSTHHKWTSMAFETHCPRRGEAR